MRETPSGVVIDDSACWCGQAATTVIGIYVGVGPLEVAVCDAHRDALVAETPGVRPITKAD